MDISGIMEKAFLQGYATGDLTVPTMFLCVFFTTMIGLYVYVVYRCINRNSFYNKNFSVSLVTLAVITSAIILTIQSNIVVSLGMVGALSIVRFRTAIKDPFDLVFLFWSISVGIICGAGFAMIAVIASVVLTIIIVLLSILPAEKNSLVLVVNAPSYECEERILEIVAQNTYFSKVRARNVTQDSLNMVIEVRTKKEYKLIEKMMDSQSVSSVSLVEHDGNITA